MGRGRLRDPVGGTGDAEATHATPEGIRMKTERLGGAGRPLDHPAAPLERLPDVSPLHLLEGDRIGGGGPGGGRAARSTHRE